MFSLLLLFHFCLLSYILHLISLPLHFPLDLETEDHVSYLVMELERTLGKNEIQEVLQSGTKRMLRYLMFTVSSDYSLW